MLENKNLKIELGYGVVLGLFRKAKKLKQMLYTKILIFLFNKQGAKIGKNVVFNGFVDLQILGDYSNLEIGDNAIIGDGMMIRLRENGKLKIAQNLTTGKNVQIIVANDSCAYIGENVLLGNNVNITSGADLMIGKNCLFAQNVNIHCSDHKHDLDVPIREQGYFHKKILIGEDCWFGANVAITKGSEVGDKTIVGSNSVVTKKLDSASIYAGVPARFIKKRV